MKVEVKVVETRPVKTKYGNRVMYFIQTDKHEKTLSGFSRKEIKVGDVLDIDVTQRGEYSNFNIIKPSGRDISTLGSLPMKGATNLSIQTIIQRLERCEEKIEKLLKERQDYFD